MAVTRINNNQITDASSGNLYTGINAGTKLQEYSITATRIANNLVYGSDLTVSGNLTVNGTSTAIDTTITTIEDPVIILASTQTGSPAVDIGFLGERGDSNNIAFVWQESSSEFVTAFTTTAETNTTISIASYANFHTNDANIGGNLVVNGSASYVGNITGDLSVVGNIIGGNLSTAGMTSTGTLEVSSTSSFTGNITSEFNVTGNLAAGNITTPGLISATGNITGGNLLTAGSGGDLILTGGNISGANVITGNTISATANVVTGNVNASGEVSATGNVIGGNITTAGFISATGNLTAGNIDTTGQISTGTLETTGNALIGGNLIVSGNITYINIDDLRVEDPIIILGTGPNGAPLSVNDGLDRGVFMEYYTTGLGNAFVGWDNSSGNMVIANDAYFTANDVVGINAYGTLEAGNLYVQSAVATGNITGGNLFTGGTISATGNIDTAANINAPLGQVSAATGYFTGNVDVLGNLNATIGVVYANSGIFYGDTVTGNNAAFAGIPGFTPLGSNVVMQFAGNVNSYSQINFENVNGGNAASTDYIATADNGDDSTYFIDMGIAGSNHTGVHDGFFADIATNNAGYLYVVASDETGPGSSGVGNLILGSTNGNVLTFVGNTNIANIRTVASIQGLDIVNGNLYASAITSRSGRVDINPAGDNVDFAVSGDTVANVFYVDAGTGTASFGTATQTTGALVAFNSPESILMPVGNTLQRPTGTIGMLRFNSTDDNLEIYSAAGWEAVGVPVFTVIADEQFDGDGSTVAFTLGSSQTTASCIVSINGVIQIPTIAYSVTGTTLTFTEAPEPGDIIDVRQITTTTTVTAISNTPGTAIVAPDPTAANLNITGNMIPSSNVVFNLGSPTARWNELFLAGNTISLGSIVMKDTGGQIGFFESDGSTPATIDSASVDTTTIANGTSSVSVVASGGNIRANVGGSQIAVITNSGMQITGDLSVTGNATLSGNILGDRIQNGTTQIDIQSQNGNANITVAGTSNVAVFASTGMFVTGLASVTGNVTTPSNVVIGSAGNTQMFIANTNLEIQNNVSTGNINFRANVDGVAGVSVLRVLGTGGVAFSGNLVSMFGNGAVANGISNIGSPTSTFNTIFAKATSAQYADLAEKYVADAEYAPGTVVVFGGSKEVTVSSTDSDTKVAGVVSTNPSYIMNGGLEAEHVATVALTGRVPTHVVGPVRKGDLMVSAENGHARAEANPRVGTVIGKALEDFDGQEGVIEVVVGRF